MSRIRFGSSSPSPMPPPAKKNSVSFTEGLCNVAGAALSLPLKTPFYGSAKHPLERDNPLLKWGYVGHKTAVNTMTLVGLVPVMGTTGLLIGAAAVGAKELAEYVLNPSHRKVMADLGKEAHESHNPWDFLGKIGQVLFHGAPTQEPTVSVEKTLKGKDTP